MKRKLAGLLTIALAISMLAGCGKDSKEETSGGSNGKKAATLSEYLNTEKTIGYTVSKMDKEKTPENIYFFKDGKVTILPGEEFGKTLGELSQMTDKEIWKKYDKAKEKYKEKYIEEKETKIDGYVNKVIEKENADLEEVQSMIDVLTAAKNNGYSIDESALYALDNYFMMENYQGDEIQEFLYNPYDTENLALVQKLTEDALGYYQNQYNSLPKSDPAELRKEYTYKGPFFDIPFAFAVETDSSGNYIENESMVYATLADNEKEAPTKFYDSLTFASVPAYENQIYDTVYTCLQIGSGKMIFCTRDAVKLDTVDSKNVLVDPADKKLDKLFKEEVNARYE